MTTKNKTGGVILAGGQSRRMTHDDKAFVLFNNRPLVSYSISAMTSVTTRTVISANRNHEAYEKFNLPVIADRTDDYKGPLAGILTAIDYLQECEILLVAPCDCPLLTADHLKKLLEAREQHTVDIAVAFDGHRLHPVLLALKTNLQASLESYLLNGNHKVDLWLKQHTLVTVDFSNEPEIFFNVNTKDDLALLQQKYA